MKFCCIIFCILLYVSRLGFISILAFIFCLGLQRICTVWLFLLFLSLFCCVLVCYRKKINDTRYKATIQSYILMNSSFTVQKRFQQKNIFLNFKWLNEKDYMKYQEKNAALYMKKWIAKQEYIVLISSPAKIRFFQNYFCDFSFNF